MPNTPIEFFDEIIADEIDWFVEFIHNAIEESAWFIKEPSIDFAIDVLISLLVVTLQLGVLILAFIYFTGVVINFVFFLLKDIFNQVINLLINLR